ncbi:hypothetical protein SESBI_36205 [Sesbania bispinosa]|nr:hypothetical protein SESBI_36205 [Sesbania bispinosa]
MEKEVSREPTPVTQLEQENETEGQVSTGDESRKIGVQEQCRTPLASLIVMP